MLTLFKTYSSSLKDRFFNDRMYFPVYDFVHDVSTVSYIEMHFTGMNAKSENELTMLLFLHKSKFPQRLSEWRFPTSTEWRGCVHVPLQSFLQNDNKFTDTFNSITARNIVLVRTVSKSEYSEFNGVIARFIKRMRGIYD